jgi:siderophore ferric iron reductase
MTASLQPLVGADKSVYLHRLFRCCQQSNPCLQGVEAEAEAGMLLPRTGNQAVVAELYRELQQHYPEGGSGYWLSRCWTLLSWQPIYIAVTAIYQTQTIPDISAIVQRKQPALVAGFSLSEVDIFSGEERQLIDLAGELLSTLLDGYFVDFAALFPRRKNWQQRFIADALLQCLLELLQPERSNASVVEHARWWLQGLKLPANFINSLAIAGEDNRLIVQRQSCCLVFKLDGRELCQGCPCVHRSKINRRG